ncbi:hypothetical protein [Gordonia alkanivorans]|uniref:hypothetical protein n=1 Tax=Gordonia alkanivorans TaxID=84096 RepID=UPI00244D15F9|nr:hypothetical protein [Gordonia alkanivorans]MDH3045347.1 hypothetical protein [Gordonia alkanivorans]
MAHDIRRHDRAASLAARMILALQAEDPEAARAVLAECHDNPAQLKDLAVTLGSLAAVNLTEEGAILYATVAADNLAGPPQPPRAV